MAARGTAGDLRPSLYAAYDWTSSAGDLGELANLSGHALNNYCRESAANARQHGSDDVTEQDLHDLAHWLRSES